MAKIFNGKVLFASAMQPTGAQPLDDRVVVQSYSDLVDVTTFGDAKYLGMIVGVVDDSKLYMLTNTDVTAEGAWKEIGAGGAVSVETYAEAVALASDENIGQVIYVKTKSSYDADGEGEGEAVEYDAAPYIVIGEGLLQKLAASTASGDIESDVAELKTTVGNNESGLVKDVTDLKTTVGNLPETFVTDVKVGETSLVNEEGIADLSNFVQKDGSKGLSTNDYTTDEKNKLAGIAVGAEVNYVKDVGDNLNVDASGKLTVTIPEVEVPFQSVAGGDKILTLSEGGELKSDLTFGKETIDGAEYLVVKGKDDVEIGKVATAEFTVDGILNDVKFSTEEGKENILVLTFNADSGKQDIEVDFGKYVDAYSAGNGLNLDNKTFAVDFTKVEAAGAAATVKSQIEAELANYAKSAEVYSKTDADSTFVKSDGYVAYTQEEKDKLAGIAEGAEVNVVKEVDTEGVLGLDGSGKLSADLSAYALSANVDTSLSSKVDKEDGKGLSTNDFTNDLKTKLEDIAAGAEVNVVKDVDTTGVLGLDGSGKLSANLSAYATSESLINGLAAKLDASAKVNGVSFENGEATLDANDIAIGTAITRTGEGGEPENVYGAEVAIQSVLASLSQRIDVLDPNVSGELGITSIVEGNGVKVETSGGQATIFVKASTVEGNMAEVKTDGVYVQDMRSYWEAI